jgi:hypothetical protein
VPNTQYTFEFSTWKGSIFAKGPHGYIRGDVTDVGDTPFLHLQADPVNDFKRKDTLQEPTPLACNWKKGAPFTTQRRNGFALIDGSPIELRLMQDWSSTTAKLGDTVKFTLVKDLEVRGVPILKAGADVDAVVIFPSALNPKYFKGRVDLVIRNLTLPDGQQVSVRTTETRQRRYSRYGGVPIVSGTGYDAVGPPYVVKKGSSIQLARDTVVTLYVEDNYLLDPKQIVQKPIEQESQN